MTANQCDIGLIGLAVMGENLVLNMESKGFSVAVFNRTAEATDKFAAARAKGKNIQPTRSREESVGALKKPRKAQIRVKVAAQVDGEPCCRYMGPDGAGHYVKMVHNGIEYGDMQLICEAYAILKNVVGMDDKQLVETFTEWNKGELDSYLIDITSQIFRKIDPETGKPLVDVILDKAGQKGSGMWTLQSAIAQSVVISTINAAVEARVISSRKDERVAASKILPQPKPKQFTGDRKKLTDAVRNALYASKIVSYAQG